MEHDTNVPNGSLRNFEEIENKTNSIAAIVIITTPPRVGLVFFVPLAARKNYVYLKLYT